MALLWDSGKGVPVTKVRHASRKDAACCAEISPLRTAEQLTDLLRDPDVGWLVVEDDEDIVVGVGIIQIWRWSKVAWVWDLTVDKKVRGKGYGRTLLKGMIEEARRRGAKVLMDFDHPSQSPLTDLYAKTGFRICGTNDRWFPNEKDTTATFYGYDL
jgi:GNAT superfamily N-acetyltransferase